MTILVRTITPNNNFKKSKQRKGQTKAASAAVSQKHRSPPKLSTSSFFTNLNSLRACSRARKNDGSAAKILLKVAQVSLQLNSRWFESHATVNGKHIILTHIVLLYFQVLFHSVSLSFYGVDLFHELSQFLYSRA